MKCDVCGAEIKSGKCTYCGKEFTEDEIRNMQQAEREQLAADRKIEEERNRKLKLTEKTWFIILLLIIFWPVGLFLMWKNARWNKILKIVITIIIVIFAFNSIKGCSGPDFGSSHYDPTEDFANFEWPTTGAAAKLPVPELETLYGEINEESEDHFSADIGNISKDDYNKYVESCRAAGFTAGYEKTSTTYEGKNKGGYLVELQYYEDDKYYYVEISSPKELEEEEAAAAELEEWANELEEEETTTTTKKTTTTTKAESNSSGIDPDFKEMMDSYEDVVDSYIEAMKNDATTADSIKMLGEYTEFAAKVDEVDEDELNEAELAYYTEVVTRCSQKLAEASL
ncbi:MAG: hypothetical protein HUJ79_07065 [Firmicutes bacterium]|nr:hypothetical protein [Bacillota bacterium]